MSAIKPGDLVMVVKPSPCCGNVSVVGRIFSVKSIISAYSYCIYCLESESDNPVADVGVGAISLSRLKKIDPPETGDSLPTRADLNLPEPACP